MHKQLSKKISDAVRNTTPLKLPTHYASLINLSCRRSKATRPEIVGQMTELFKQFPGKSASEWKRWYLKKNEGVLLVAHELIRKKLYEIGRAFKKINDDDIWNWIIDLVTDKTYSGLAVETTILKSVAKEVHKGYKASSVEDEKKNIDGYIGGRAVQVKPASFKRTSEKKQGKLPKIIIYYYYNKETERISYDYNKRFFK